MVKNVPAMQETWVRSLAQEDPLPEEFHGQRSLLGYSPWGYKVSNSTEQLTFWVGTDMFEEVPSK